MLNKDYVYGIFINYEDGKQLLFQFGMFNSEENALNFIEKQKLDGAWAEKIKIQSITLD